MNKSMCVESDDSPVGHPHIVVVGCGGAGNNVVNGIHEACPENVQTIALNTDKAALDGVRVHKKVFLGEHLTDGCGAKGDPELGERCAWDALAVMKNVLEPYDLVFIVAGMGGGTGTGTAPVVAEIAQSMGKVAFPIAIHPFSFEGSRIAKAKEGIARLKRVTDGTLILSNDKLLDSNGGECLNAVFDRMQSNILSIVRECSDSCHRTLSTVEIHGRPSRLHEPVTVTMQPMLNQDLGPVFGHPQLD